MEFCITSLTYSHLNADGKWEKTAIELDGKVQTYRQIKSAVQRHAKKIGFPSRPLN